jgi:hypothetical protein
VESVRRRVASLAGAVLVFVAAVVVELTALVPATASAARNPVTAYVTADSSGTVTPINLVTTPPAPRSRSPQAAVRLRLR